MVTDLGTYTGKILYREIEFSFSFDKEELRLIPPAEKRHEVEMWFMRELPGGEAYTMGNPVYIENDTLEGKCNETGQTIIFITAKRQVGRYNSVLLVPIDAYVIKKYDRQLISRMTFRCAELDCIYPVTQALNWPDWSDDGTVSISTKNFDDTTTQRQGFHVGEKLVTVQFGITRSTSGKIGQPPLSLYSTMMFEFQPTKDYGFIYRLWYIAKSFLQYLCYRKNVYLPRVGLASPYKEGKHEPFADLYLMHENGECETEALEKGRYIKQQYIDGCEAEILNSIANGTIYLRHLPETYRSGRCIDAARFVMITAAFEWEFKQQYRDGVRKKETTIAAEKAAAEALEGLFQNSSGKLREKYRYLKKRVKDDSMQSEIEQVGIDFSTIIDLLGTRLYSLNGETLVYSEMGKRLSDQRNHFAHGDLDQEFIDLSLLDLIYMEYIVYAMQLKRHGVEEGNIQKAINELFRCGIAL